MRRTLAVRAPSSGGARLLSLNRDTFNRILGSIKHYLKEDYTGAKNGPIEPNHHRSQPHMVGVDGAFVLTSEENDDGSHQLQ